MKWLSAIISLMTERKQLKLLRNLQIACFFNVSFGVYNFNVDIINASTAFSVIGILTNMQ